MEGAVQAESSRKRARDESNADIPRQGQAIRKDAAHTEGSRKRARDESDVGEPCQDFVYSPLDHQAPSIRLIRVLEDLSPDGHIQCEVHHASTASNYVCLSYVWGGAEEGQWILLNGRRLWIRDNLGQFLLCARQKPQVQREWLWIDALCIDQDNNTERSHQVQQMGQIYEHATRVISWFGMNPEIVAYFNSVASYRLFSLKDGASFHNSEYWKRAWITQEFGLARQSTFMAGMSDIDSERIPFFETENNAPVHSDDGAFELIARINYERSALKGQRLFYLLDKLRDKQCSNARDRIFSLIALCSDCPNLNVDYDIPPQDLALSILSSCESSVCFCSAGFLDQVLKAERLGDGKQLPCANTPLPGTMDLVTPFAPHPGRKEFWIPVSLERFCSQASGYIIIHISSASSTFFDSAVDEITYRWYPPQTSSPSARRPVHGCTIQISSGRNACTLMFSLAMFLEITKIGKRKGRHGCCSRVTSPQTGGNNAAAISVHQKQIRMEICMNFKGTGWQRGYSDRTERRL